MKRKIKENKGLVFGLIAGFLVLAGIIMKISMIVNKFKRNSDFFFWMDSDEVDFSGAEFEDTSISSAMSSVKVDLSTAKPAEGPMNLRVKAFSSSVDVILPEKWNVKIQGDENHSTLNNEVKFDPENFELPLLFINYKLDKSTMNIYHSYFSYSEAKKVETEMIPAEAN